MGPTLAAAAALAAAVAPPAWLDVRDGATQPVLRGAPVEQTVFVRTPVDSDRDGRRDRVRIRISRPRDRTVRVPVIFEHSPYLGRTGRLVNHRIDRAPRTGPPGRRAGFYVRRGYAVVRGESLGTGRSDGCPTVGDRRETLAARAVIDWLNDRAAGFTRGGRRVRARWSSGAVAMTGVSYDGTLANQVAATGVPGLRTIVPISAISRWYDYYRANGLVVAPHSGKGGTGRNGFQGEDMDVLARSTAGARATGRCAGVVRRIARRQDRRTGDWNAFWRARDPLAAAHRVRAAVLLVHGLEDWNVRPRAFASWWEALGAAGVPRRLWLHPGGHGPPVGRGARAYRRLEHRWLDFWLHGVRNGAATGPPVTLQRRGAARREEAAWPAPGSAPALLRLSADGRTPGGLGPAPAGAAPQSFVDRGRQLDTDAVLIRRPDAVHANRLVYRSAPLRAAARLSGTPRVALRLSVDNRRSANVTAVLVDYALQGRPRMVTRGWMDPRNRAGIGRSLPLRPGEAMDLRFDLQPDDHVFRAGHRIGLVVVGTDHDYTLRPPPGTRLTLWPAQSVLELPLVGGALAP